MTMSRTARKVAATYRPGVRVVGTDGPSIASGEKRHGTVEGTVTRFVPGGNAQGGTIVVQWDNGRTGRHSAGSLAVVGT